MSSWQVFNYPCPMETATSRTPSGRWCVAASGKSEKAIVTDLLGLVPEDWRIRQEVFSADDREAIRSAMLSGVEAGFSIGPKVCRSTNPHLGNGPWQTGIKTAEEVDSFLNDTAYVGRGPYGGYLTWINDPAVTELVVVFDPPGKGEPELNASTSSAPCPAWARLPRCRSCSCSARPACVLSSRRLRARSFSSRWNPTISIRTTWRLVRPIVGRDYEPVWTRRSPRLPCRAVTGLSAGCVDSSMPGAWQSPSRWPGSLCGQLWTPPFDLPHYMIALDDEFGLETLEFQGRADSGGRIAFFKLFDAKGHEEQLIADRV